MGCLVGTLLTRTVRSSGGARSVMVMIKIRETCFKDFKDETFYKPNVDDRQSDLNPNRIISWRGQHCR